MPHQPVSSLTVAKRVLDLANKQERPVTPLLMLKMVYIAHGFFMALHETALITDNVEAWKYGPVIPTLYERIRHYKAGGIRGLGELPDETLDELQTDLVDTVFDKYKKYTGWELSYFTHQDGAPWRRVWKQKGWNGIIPNENIREHYKTLLVNPKQ